MEGLRIEAWGSERVQGWTLRVEGFRVLGTKGWLFRLEKLRICWFMVRTGGLKVVECLRVWGLRVDGFSLRFDDWWFSWWWIFPVDGWGLRVELLSGWRLRVWRFEASGWRIWGLGWELQVKGWGFEGWGVRIPPILKPQTKSINPQSSNSQTPTHFQPSYLRVDGWLLLTFLLLARVSSEGWG